MIQTILPPLSLYIHIPWCIRKCPYCDFNSHAAKGGLPEEAYVNALLKQLESHLHLVEKRPVISVFFGGGTPSLFSGDAIAAILEGVDKRLAFAQQVEVTLEANPGTVDQAHFTGYEQAGVNRISLGAQSFQHDKLVTLGRIHEREHTLRAIDAIHAAGIANFNIDLMYGLPEQTVEDALSDLEEAIRCKPTHLSWYQLTIEPNTVFYKRPPTLPIEDSLIDMQEAGQRFIAESGYQQYEVSAYASPHAQCVHNRNYWEFGDYLGMGAGAHSKITSLLTSRLPRPAQNAGLAMTPLALASELSPTNIIRFSQVKQPSDYLLAAKREDKNLAAVCGDDLIFEFMLNALRLTDGVPIELFSRRTGLPLSYILPLLHKAKERGLLLDFEERLCATALGGRFLNELVGLFVPE